MSSLLIVAETSSLYSVTRRPGKMSKTPHTLAATTPSRPSPSTILGRLGARLWNAVKKEPVCKNADLWVVLS